VFAAVAGIAYGAGPAPQTPPNMRRTLALALLLCLPAAHADEGMWMPSQLPTIADQLRAAGYHGDPAGLADLTAPPMSAVVSLGGCTASFVSPEGLVVTNHHCARGAIQLNSTPQDNLLENGFIAASSASRTAIASLRRRPACSPCARVRPFLRLATCDA
jgi:hypothetical protein